MTTTAESFAGGRYRVARVMGRGGMATVYLARDAMLDRQVAVKVLAEHLADDPAFVRRFRREASIAARLVHPHIVELLDVGDERGASSSSWSTSTGRRFTISSNGRARSPLPASPSSGGRRLPRLLTRTRRGSSTAT